MNTAAGLGAVRQAEKTLAELRQVLEFNAILYFVRDNGRCPAQLLLHSWQGPMQKRFLGQFGAVERMGARYEQHERFTPLRGAGKPLWEFKEFDHRLYCVREVEDHRVRIVLLDGWVKDKKGKTARESREIEAAQKLYAEYQAFRANVR